jgi:Zn ribbon nucleic-acid-binding protein
VITFECPICLTVEYSSWSRRDVELISCSMCGEKYKNPHYDKNFKARIKNDEGHNETG